MDMGAGRVKQDSTMPKHCVEHSRFVFTMDTVLSASPKGSQLAVLGACIQKKKRKQGRRRFCVGEDDAIHANKTAEHSWTAGETRGKLRIRHVCCLQDGNTRKNKSGIQNEASHCCHYENQKSWPGVQP